MSDHEVHCSDGGCIFGHPGGMATNGGCIPTMSEARNWTLAGRCALRDRIKALAAERDYWKRKARS